MGTASQRALKIELSKSIPPPPPPTPPPRSWLEPGNFSRARFVQITKGVDCDTLCRVIKEEIEAVAITEPIPR